MDENPKVFISHASEDKGRFVKDFALRLRNQGVDAWFDKWEIKPGDSLVDKIFEEGIGECSAFIIILSKDSVNKKWVKEELDSAVIRRIEKSTKIIPVVIDENVNIPKSVKHIVRVTITNLDNYEEDFDEIISSIYDLNQKPPLGEAPKYVSHKYVVPGLNSNDSLVLKAAGDVVLKRNANMIMGFSIIKELEDYGISTEAVEESLEILESRGFVRIQTMGGGINRSPIKLTSFGFSKYADYHVENIEEIQKDVVSLLMNDKLTDNKQIASILNVKTVIITSILEYYNDKGYIKAEMFMGGHMKVLKINAAGKRYFRELLS